MKILDRGECVLRVTGACALAMLEPVKALVSAPVAYREHHLLDVLSHFAKIARAIARVKNDFASLLSEGNGIASEDSICLLVVNLDMELFVSVHAIATTWQILTSKFVLVNVNTALSRSVTLLIDSICGSIARVANSSVGKLVGLHDIKLWAEMSIDRVGVAVLPRIFSGGLCWHQDSVEGCNTAATYFAQVDVVFESASEHIWHEVFAGVQLFLGRQIDSIVVLEIQLGAFCSDSGPIRVHLKPQFLFFAINFDIKRRVSRWDVVSLFVLASAHSIGTFPEKRVIFRP